MIKIFKIIKWFLRRVFIILTGYILRILLHRNNNTIIFHAKHDGTVECFAHNTKYLFLYLNSINADLKTIWLCDDKTMLNIFEKYHFKNVYSSKSFKGIYYALKSKYWFFDYTVYDLPQYLINGATLINAWHGIPLKKIMADDKIGHCSSYGNLKGLAKVVYYALTYKEKYFITNNIYDNECMKTAFLLDEDSLSMQGSPRTDALFQEFKNVEMFMEDDFNNIKNLSKQGKKLIVYVPTFRDTGKDISSWMQSERLKNFLDKNNIVLICKLHHNDKSQYSIIDEKCFYKMNNQSDIYAILKYTDALITDYSSINFDYLLLDKPIVYYVPDLQEYQEKCRGFYTSYEEFAAGNIVKTEVELISALENVINGKDEYQEQRRLLRDKMFKYQDGKNCERVVNWIKSLG